MTKAESKPTTLKPITDALALLNAAREATDIAQARINESEPSQASAAVAALRVLIESATNHLRFPPASEPAAEKEDDDTPHVPTDAELNEAANKRDAKAAYYVLDDMSVPMTGIGNLADAIVLIAEGIRDDDRLQGALYGAANAIEDTLSDLQEKRDQSSDLLWGYSEAGSRRVKDAAP